MDTSVLRMVTEDLAILLSEVTVGDLGQPTLSAGRDLGDLYLHLIEQNAIVAAAISGESRGRLSPGPTDRASLVTSANLYGGGFEEDYRRTAQTVADLFAGIEGNRPIIDNGNPVDPFVLLHRHIENTVRHTLAISRALGLPHEPTEGR